MGGFSFTADCERLKIWATQLADFPTTPGSRINRLYCIGGFSWLKHAFLRRQFGIIFPTNKPKFISYDETITECLRLRTIRSLPIPSLPLSRAENLRTTSRLGVITNSCSPTILCFSPSTFTLKRFRYLTMLTSSTGISLFGTVQLSSTDTGAKILGFKGSDQWKMRGIGKLVSVRRWYRTVAIDVCLLFYLVVGFSETYFRFLFVKPR